MGSASLFAQISQATPLVRKNTLKHDEQRDEGEEIEEIGKESDVECWLRMLALQKEFHCYNSARLEAAVEALERGCSIDEVSIREFSNFV